MNGTKLTYKFKLSVLIRYKSALSMQGGAKRLPNYHLVGEIWVLVGENLLTYQIW